jgi:protein SCO1/2
MMRTISLAVLVFMSFIVLARADQRSDDALQISQRVIGSTLPGLSFTDTENKRVAIDQLRGKPLLISLIYTSCSDVCPAVIESLAPAATAAEELLGKNSFNIVTIGFDTRNDTPQRMKSFARAHNASGENWYFLASDQATVDKLASAVGFSYFSSAGGFDHLSQITLADKDGRIYDQIYGSSFAPPAVVEPLKSLVFGSRLPAFSLGGLGDRVKLFCTVFDPRTGRYYFNYSILITIITGATCLLGVLYFLVREIRKSVASPGA